MLVGLIAIPLVWLSNKEYQSQPFNQANNVIDSLVKVVVLVDALMKEEKGDR
ncbi:MAG: hypothetical protein F6K17_10790 [Okeania sp. SIO3C4]|nr:hypothetical protein [Okeania sp. SIO3B3]NER03073.1 hypothetical protein [Okeania sp. SIO3C4]